MSEERLQELTRKHDEALERLERQEAAARRNRWTMIASLIGALGAGGGGATAYFGNDDESIKTVVATHIATDDQWKGVADGDISALLEQQQALRDAVIRLQVTVENLSEKHRGGAELRRELGEVGRLLEGMPKPAERHKAKPAPAPAAADVQQLRDDLFE